MNTENLNGILVQYIQHCKSRAAAEEGSFWRAADCFGVNWDIDDSDFPAMFADATQQARLALDNPALQPIGGMQNLMLRGTEIELVRECFRWLFKADDGDISKRRGRVELFADQINGRFRRVFPRMTKYTMNAAHAAYLLNLWSPRENYFYNAAEAKAWADYFDYEADFGTGAALNLPRYYTMCNDLLAALEAYPELLALHKAYVEQELGGVDDANHLLVYDILHTAYTEQLYPKGYARTATTKERAKAVQEKATRAELCARIGEAEQELQELLANPAQLPDLTGCKITHKMFGAGTVQPAEGQFMVIDFGGTLKKFSYTASMNSGYLTAEDPAVEDELQAYQDYNKTKDCLEKELKAMKAELVKM